MCAVSIYFSCVRVCPGKGGERATIIKFNIFQPNFGILLLLEGSFREFRFYCLDQKLVYVCPF